MGCGESSRKQVKDGKGLNEGGSEDHNITRSIIDHILYNI